MAPEKQSFSRALIVLDGLGDLPHPSLGNRSPVEAARTPNLDRLMGRGIAGELRVIGEGVAPESDAGVLALLGYDPQRDSPGRGVLEALGIGAPLSPGDVAFRVNFATAEGDGRVVDARVGRGLTTMESTELADALTKADLLGALKIQARVVPTVGHRGVLVLHPLQGSVLSANVSNSDPFYDRRGGMGQAREPDEPRPRLVGPLDSSAVASRTAQAVNNFLAGVPAVLAGHRVNAGRALGGRPVANLLLLRQAGALPRTPLPSFSQRYGVAGAAVTEMPVERGIARLLGLSDLYVGPIMGELSSGYRDRARVTRKAIDDQPFVYVHLKGPDEPGHDGQPDKKRDIIEAIDESFFGPFLDGLELTKVRVAVTADHATPCILRRHSDDPVPWLLVGEGLSKQRSDSQPSKFGASRSSRDMYGIQYGRELLPRLMESGPEGPV